MGIGSYFKGGKAPAPQSIPQAESQMTQVTRRVDPEYMQQLNVHQGPQRGYDGRISGRASETPSVRSVQSQFFDDIKHEVMANYLYQQQCGHLWIADGNGVCEGVLLRKSRNNYFACPPQLADSEFAKACAELNVQVSIMER